MQSMYLVAAVLLITVCIGAPFAIYVTRENTTGQMTAEQVMKMLPQSVAVFQYGDLHTMRETAGLQEWYNDIVSSYLSSGLIDPDSTDYFLWTDSLIVLGGRFDFESIRNSLENWNCTVEEYEGYQIFKQYYSGLVLVGDKILSGDVEAVKNFIDVLKGDKASVYENSAYDEIKSEITGGFIISVGKSILSSQGEKMLGYSVNQGSTYSVDNFVIDTARVKAVYVYDNQSVAEAALESFESEVRTQWIAGGSAVIEQKNNTIVITITPPMQSVRDLIGYVVGSAAPAIQLTFQNSVSWNATREDNGDIAVSYHDTTSNTISANVKIENLAGQIENEINFQNTSTFSFAWTGAENSLTYKVVLTVQHNVFDEVSETKLV